MATTYRLREAAARAGRKHEEQANELTALTERVQALTVRVETLESSVMSLLIASGSVIEYRPVVPVYVKQPQPQAARVVRFYGTAIVVR